MRYKKLLEKVPDSEIVSVEMIDGTTIKCKKIPFSAIEMMNDILPGMKEAVHFIGEGLSSVATYSGKELFYAAGDVSKYVTKSDGTFLSVTRGANGKFDAQPGFVKAGLEAGKAAAPFAKALPWVGLAIMVVETGTKIVLRQKQIKAEQIAVYENYQDKLDEHVNNLMVAANDYTISISDDFTRGANINIINNAFNYANNIFKKMEKDAESKKYIDEHIVFTMKSALNLYSFAKMLKIMFSKVEDIKYINDSLDDILEKTAIFDKVFEESYKQHLEKREKNNKLYKATQFKNESKQDKTKRIAIGVASGGVSELINYESKKEQNKLDNTIKELDKCNHIENPYVECIENVSNVVEQKHMGSL